MRGLGSQEVSAMHFYDNLGPAVDVGALQRELQREIPHHLCWAPRWDR